MNDPHVLFMRQAIKLAGKGGERGEIPIAALIIKDGKIIARAHNLTRTKKDPVGHAEMVAIRRAAAKIKNERFLGTSIYVTLEPCAMCAGAIVQARIPTVIFGAYDAKAGACGSVFKILPNKRLNHRPYVKGGVCAEQSVDLLKQFFQKRRAEIKALKSQQP